MAVQLSIPFETLVELVEQLPSDQQQALLIHLLDKTKNRPTSAADKKALLESMMVDLGAVSPEYSDRRDDWYGDDGR
ncbi:MAG: hypothetical protein IT319_00040 [Anaerolineae bacterium]|nr:hypothetical protein [Anaerolineae bacterium]